MSKKITTVNKNFLVSEVRALLKEFDPEEVDRNEPFSYPEPGRDLGNTDKLPGDEDLGAVNVDALEMQGEPGDLDKELELLLTIIFGMPQSREAVAQHMQDTWKFGLGTKADILKAIDSIPDITPFEAFVFRFLETEYSPKLERQDVELDLVVKSEIFEEIDKKLEDYSRKIFEARGSDEDQIKDLFSDFLSESYKEIYEKYDLTGEGGLIGFGGFTDAAIPKFKLVNKPTERMSDSFYKEFKNSNVISNNSLKKILEKYLTGLVIPLASGRNPTGKPITSFKQMRNVMKGKTRFGLDRTEPYDTKVFDEKRILGAVSVRENYLENIDLINLVVSYIDVFLSIIGSVSLLGLAGKVGTFLGIRVFNALVRVSGLRDKLIKKAIKETIKKNMNKFTIAKWAAGADFLLSIGLVFFQTINSIENRYRRVLGFDKEFFSLLEQRNNSLPKANYVKRDVDAWDYTSGNFEDVYNAVLNKFGIKRDVEAPEKEEISIEEINKKLLDILDGGILSLIPDTNDKIVAALNLALTYNKDLPSLDDIGSRIWIQKPGSSIIECWSHIYLLSLKLVSGVVLSEISKEESSELTSLISEEEDNRKGYKEFLMDMYLAYFQLLKNDPNSAVFKEAKEKIQQRNRTFEKFLKLIAEKEKSFKESIRVLKRKAIEIENLKKHKKDESRLKESKISNLNEKNGKSHQDLKFTQIPNSNLYSAKGHNGVNMKLSKYTSEQYTKLDREWRDKLSVPPLLVKSKKSTYRPDADLKHSQHKTGNALDIEVDLRDSVSFQNTLLFYANKHNFKGFGFSGNTFDSMHIDTRGDKNWWYYDNDKKGTRIQGDTKPKNKWDYRYAPDVVAEILIGNEFNEFASGSSWEKQHARSIAQYEKWLKAGKPELPKLKKSLRQEIEDELRERLPEAVWESIPEIAKKIIDKGADKAEEWFLELGDETEEVLNNLSNKATREIKKVVKGMTGFVNRKKKELSPLGSEVVRDEKFHKPKYNENRKDVQNVNDFYELSSEYLKIYGMSQGNVIGTATKIQNYVDILEDEKGLSSFYKAKKREFDINVIKKYQNLLFQRKKSGTLEEQQLPKEEEGSIEIVLKFDVELKEPLKFTKEEETQRKQGVVAPPSRHNPSIFDKGFTKLATDEIRKRGFKDTRLVMRAGSKTLKLSDDGSSLTQEIRYFLVGPKRDMQQLQSTGLDKRFLNELKKKAEEIQFGRVKINGFRVPGSLTGDMPPPSDDAGGNWFISRVDLEEFLKTEEGKKSSQTLNKLYDIKKKLEKEENPDEIEALEAEADLLKPVYIKLKDKEDKEEEKNKLTWPPPAPLDHTEYNKKVVKDSSAKKGWKLTSAVLENPKTATKNFSGDPNKTPEQYYKVEDPYKSHEFMERERLVEYIPGKFLLYTDENMYTATFDIPDGKFNEFVPFNPTIVYGKNEFDKAAPGQRETERNRLLIILQRNRQVFIDFLEKLESLPIERITVRGLTMEDYRIYRDYYRNYIKIFNYGINAIKNKGSDSISDVIRSCYHLNILRAALYSL